MKYWLFLLALSFQIEANDDIADEICNAYKNKPDVDKCFLELSEDKQTSSSVIAVESSSQKRPNKIDGKYPVGWVIDRMFWAMDRRALICQTYWPSDSQMQLKCQQLQRAAVPKIQDIIESLDRYSPKFAILIDCLNLWQKGGSIDLEMIPTCYDEIK